MAWLEPAPLPAFFAVLHCPLAASAEGRPAVRELQELRGVIPGKNLRSAARTPLRPSAKGLVHCAGGAHTKQPLTRGRSPKCVFPQEMSPWPPLVLPERVRRGCGPGALLTRAPGQLSPSRNPGLAFHSSWTVSFWD